MTHMVGMPPGDEGGDIVDNTALSTASQTTAAAGVGNSAQPTRNFMRSHRPRRAIIHNPQHLLRLLGFLINLQMGKA